MSTVDELRVLYKQGMGWKEFFDSIASYQKPMAELTAERAVEKSGLAHETIVTGFKQLAELEIGEFKYGRRGGKTRILWNYSPGSVGRVAQGLQNELESYSEDEQVVLDEPDPEADEGELTAARMSVMIEQAKQRLAQQLGIDAKRIEIAIRW